MLDYDPSNTTYSRQVDDLLNEADREICSSKPFTFINKATDVTAYKDRSGSIAVTDGSKSFTTVPAFFESWMVNQELELEGETYIILSVTSTTAAIVDKAFVGSSSTYSGTVINRYLDIPADCTTILGVARRTNTRTPNSPGMLTPLTRYEDEWNNLPLGEINLPTFWVFADPAYLESPRVNFTATLTTPGGGGRGTRTVEFTSTFIRGGRESPHGQTVSLSAVDTNEFVLTPIASNVLTGLYKRYYFRCTGHGYNAWRLLDDPTAAAGTPFEVGPTDVAARTLTALYESTLTTTETLWKDARLESPDGFIQRIRLYPRQDKDYVFTIRYMQAHKPMRENSDVSAIPPDQRMIIAYKALSDVLIKHDNPVQSELYRKRYDAMLLKLERRYLITPSRRIVKGNWLANMEPNSYSRFSTLVHT